MLLRERDDPIASAHRAGASTRPPRQERRLSLDELGCCAGARQRPVVADPPWCWQLPTPAPGAGTTHDQRHCAAIWTRGPACLVEADHQGGLVRRRVRAQHALARTPCAPAMVGMASPTVYAGPCWRRVQYDVWASLPAGHCPR